ncbi:MAG: hypothetical protein KHY24_08015, partial [Clostridiales bacterium]|nr:hypothetical protein [Clostridiales bacterium]
MADNKINVVVCSEQTEYKVNIKNKLDEEKFDVIGYSEFGAEAKRRIQGFVPDVTIFALDS